MAVHISEAVESILEAVGVSDETSQFWGQWGNEIAAQLSGIRSSTQLRKVATPVLAMAANRRATLLPALAVAGFNKDSAGSGGRKILDVAVGCALFRPKLAEIAGEAKELFPHNKDLRRRAIIATLRQYHQDDFWNLINNIDTTVRAIGGGEALYAVIYTVTIADIAVAGYLMSPAGPPIWGPIVGGIMMACGALAQGLLASAKEELEGGRALVLYWLDLADTWGEAATNGFNRGTEWVPIVLDPQAAKTVATSAWPALRFRPGVTWSWSLRPSVPRGPVPDYPRLTWWRARPLRRLVDDLVAELRAARLTPRPPSGLAI